MDTRVTFPEALFLSYKSNDLPSSQERLHEQNQGTGIALLVLMGVQALFVMLMGASWLVTSLVGGAIAVSAVAHFYLRHSMLSHVIMGVAAAGTWLALLQASSAHSAVHLLPFITLTVMTGYRGVYAPLIFSLLVLLTFMLGANQAFQVGGSGAVVVFNVTDAAIWYVFLAAVLAFTAWSFSSIASSVRAGIEIHHQQAAYEHLSQQYQSLQNRLNGFVSVVDEAGLQASHDGIDAGSIARNTCAELSDIKSHTDHIEQIVHKTTEHTDDILQRFSEVERLANQGAEEAAEANKAVHVIASSNREVVEIVSVVDEIAFQTNLLALNASVEAARAGQAGAGFSVVATEVRNLAQRSAESAREIRQLIEESTTKIQSGLDRVRSSRKTSANVIEQARQLNELISQVAESSRSQGGNISHIRNKVESISDNMQSGSAYFDQLIATSEKLTQAGNAVRQQNQNDSFRKVG